MNRAVRDYEVDCNHEASSMGGDCVYLAQVPAIYNEFTCIGEVNDFLEEDDAWTGEDIDGLPER